MFGKRIDKPGGSRRSLREEIMIRAAIMTMAETVSADLIDLSRSGARFRGATLPSAGQEVLILLGKLEAFGTVVWLDEDQCGIKFDIELSDSAVAIVENERPSPIEGLDTETAMIAGDWLSGFAR